MSARPRFVRCLRSSLRTNARLSNCVWPGSARTRSERRSVEVAGQSTLCIRVPWLACASSNVNRRCLERPAMPLRDQQRDESRRIAGYWDEIVSGRAPADDRVSGEVASAIRGAHAIADIPGPDPGLVAAMWTDVLTRVGANETRVLSLPPKAARKA